MQDSSWIRLRWAELAGYYRCECLPGEKVLEKVIHRAAIIFSVNHQGSEETQEVILMPWAYSKFLVHKPMRTPLLSRYSISSTRPGCGSCDNMASDSIARILAWAADCWGSGREWMWSKMSVLGEMERAALEGEGRESSVMRRDEQKRG